MRESENNENWRSILSDKPSLKSLEGWTFIGIGTVLYVSVSVALQSYEADPAVAFFFGIVFVLVLEPFRARLAGRVAEREEVIEE